MTENFEIGDAVEYEDTYTGELRHGRITSMAGGNVMIRTIPEKEAGKNPKRLPKPCIACSFDRPVEHGAGREAHIALVISAE